MTDYAGRFSSYPSGFDGGVVIQGLPILIPQSGNRYWVDSGSNRGSSRKGSFQNPFLTTAGALLETVSGRGDIIMCKEGHAETLTAAAAIVASQNGVKIVGLGVGSRRPTFTFGTSTLADIDITGVGVEFHNLRFVGNIDALAAPIDVGAAGFKMIGCEMVDTTTLNTVRWILGDANADDMQIIGCVNRGTDTAGNTAWITLNGADGVVVASNRSNGNFAAANIEVVTAAITDGLITGNHLENANAVDVNIELFAACTGWVSRNFCRVATDGQVTAINTPGNTSLFENYLVNNNGETGILAGTPSV